MESIWSKVLAYMMAFVLLLCAGSRFSSCWYLLEPAEPGGAPGVLDAEVGQNIRNSGAEQKASLVFSSNSLAHIPLRKAGLGLGLLSIQTWACLHTFMFY